MSKKVAKRSDAELARKACMDVQELDKIHLDFVKDLPSHHWPRLNGFCVGENRESVFRLCLDDIRFLRRALECQEHWFLTQDVKSIPESQVFSHAQNELVSYLEHSFSLRKFLSEIEVPDVDNDEDLPF